MPGGIFTRPLPPRVRGLSLPGILGGGRSCHFGRPGGRLAGRQFAGAVRLGQRRDLGVGQLRLGRRRDLRRRLDAADLRLRLGDLGVAGVGEGGADDLPLGR